MSIVGVGVIGFGISFDGTKRNVITPIHTRHAIIRNIVFAGCLLIAFFSSAIE